jgi:prevent-host-death family protein
LDDVRTGREVVITERGRAVARIVPVRQRKSFPDLAAVRQRRGAFGVSLSQTVIDNRNDRV